MVEVFKSNYRKLMHYLVFTTFLFLAVSPIYAKKPEWFIQFKQIKVFESTRSDVEKRFESITITKKVLDDPNNIWGETVEYETKDGFLEVFYSTGKCSKDKVKEGWNVDKDIVVSIMFEHFESVNIFDFGYNLKTFEETGTIDSIGRFTYYNEKKGVRISALNGQADIIEFDIPEKYLYLSCEKVFEAQKRAGKQ